MVSVEGFGLTAKVLGCKVLEITDELLCDVMSRREELKDALTPNQKVLLPLSQSICSRQFGEPKTGQDQR
jgi:hypothetical protein